MTTKRPTVAEIRAIEARGQKLSMLSITTADEAAGIDMLSIEGRFFSPEMREAAGRCFVQVGLPYGGRGNFEGRSLATAEDYLRAAFHFAATGGDCFYCAGSFDIQMVLCDNHIPIVAHVGLIPSYIAWTGFRAVGKTATEARKVWEQVQRLEAIGCFGTELEVVPDGLGAWISRNTSMIMLGMGAGPGADAQYRFAEDVLGYSSGHKPRHAKTYRDFRAEYDRRQAECLAAFGEFNADVASGANPEPRHVVPMADAEFAGFLSGVAPATPALAAE